MSLSSSSTSVEKLPKAYRVNEIFYSLQGEGLRAGTANIFLRFTGCNLKCSRETEGFDCDTEFQSGRPWTLESILAEMHRLAPHCRSIILTGGEPGLQIDAELIQALKAAGFYIAIETNGTKELPEGIDWITLSPKTAEHSLRQKTANELKYVRSYGMGIPKPSVIADHYLLSPAFDGEYLPPENLEWCLRLVRENPDWRLSVQQHKFWKIR
jgi:organic radical activating enzyme